MIAIVCPKANMARPDEADQVPIRKYRVLVSEVALFTRSLKYISKEKTLWPNPPNLVIGDIPFIINNPDHETFLGRMGNPVLGSKLIPREHIALMHRIDNPARMILTRLDPSIIHPKICAELKRSLDDIASVPHVLEHAIPDPEVWLNSL